MASFDFIEASSKGFEFVWDKAPYLLKVAIPVIFVKVFCLLTAFVMMLDINSLTYGLVLFPSRVIEAIYVIGLIRYYTYGEPIYVWGKLHPPPEEHIPPPAPNRIHSMQIGIAVYCLIQLIAHFLFGIISVDIGEEAQTSPPPELTQSEIFTGSLIMLAILYAALWSIKLNVIHIPMTLNIRAADYLRKAKGIGISLRILCAIIICSAPIFIAIAATQNLLTVLFGAQSAPFIVGGALATGILDVLHISILTVAITFGICHMISDKENN